ncbi:hypothetical protein MLD38_001873 [Melastoma candidum]|uniref:Uncharacterized protein n=1 Tax=Melastoma candidum TaxID=119954 RepID=A0ACB9SFY1_9MYRT|nr:hypothetical protein MLD38_001873 [Melastoma candidum]
MGACFSQTQLYDPLHAARVISVDGELHEYAVPVTASCVLLSEAAAAPSTQSSSSSEIFVCDSDRLYYEERIPALAPGDELVDGQIYFVLHGSRLSCRITGKEMAALAVKASLALRKWEERRQGCDHWCRKASVHISPVAEAASNDIVTGFTVSGRSASNVSDNRHATRLGSFRRTTRVSSSRRGKAAVGLSRARLSTICEEK